MWGITRTQLGVKVREAIENIREENKIHMYVHREETQK